MDCRLESEVHVIIKTVIPFNEAYTLIFMTINQVFLYLSMAFGIVFLCFNFFSYRLMAFFHF